MRKVKINILAIIGMMVALVTVAFKQVLNEPISGFYTISVIEDGDIEEPTDQLIESFVNDEPPTDGICDLFHQKEPCQVNLDLSNFNSTISVENMTVEEAELAGAVIVEYARKDQ